MSKRLPAHLRSKFGRFICRIYASDFTRGLWFIYGKRARVASFRSCYGPSPFLGLSLHPRNNLTQTETGKYGRVIQDIHEALFLKTANGENRWNKSSS